MVAAREHRAAGGPAPGQQVDPGDRVAVAVVGVGEAGHQVVEVARAFGVDAHQRGLDRQQPDRRGEDHPGQAHAARRRLEQRRARHHRTDLPVGGEQFQGQHMAGEGTGDVVVLAVDVGADRPADGHIAGAGRDRHEPAERQQHLHQPVQGDARVAQHGAAVGVDRVHPVQARHVEHGTARVLRRVPVGPSQPSRDAPARAALPDREGGLLVRPRADQPGGGGSGAAPPRDGNGVGRHDGDRIAPM